MLEKKRNTETQQGIKLGYSDSYILNFHILVWSLLTFLEMVEGNYVDYLIHNLSANLQLQ